MSTDIEIGSDEIEFKRQLDACEEALDMLSDYDILMMTTPDKLVNIASNCVMEENVHLFAHRLFATDAKTAKMLYDELAYYLEH